MQAPFSGFRQGMAGMSSNLGQTSRDRKTLFRDAEMTIKIIFERSSQKGVRRGGSKRGSTGDPS